MVKQRRRTTAQLDEMLAKMRQTDALQQYKWAKDTAEMQEAQRTAQALRNMQSEYGRLVEAHARLPQALMEPGMIRMGALADAMERVRKAYPRNFPRGPSMHDQGRDRDYRRLIAQ